MTKRLSLNIAIVVSLLLASIYYSNNLVAGLIISIAVFLLIGMGIIVHRRIILPIRNLQKHVRRISTYDFAPVPHKAFMCELEELAHEIEILSNTLNEKVGMSESMLANIMTPMVVVGTDGKIKWLNESIVRLVELDGIPENYIGEDFSTFFMLKNVKLFQRNA